jgi:hypothetical protein
MAGMLENVWLFVLVQVPLDGAPKVIAWRAYEPPVASVVLVSKPRYTVVGVVYAVLRKNTFSAALIAYVDLAIVLFLWDYCYFYFLHHVVLLVIAGLIWKVSVSLATSVPPASIALAS